MGERKKHVMQREGVTFWFDFRVGWVAVVMRWWQPPVAERFLAWEGGMWGVYVPLHERTGLNSADAGPTAALEMVRDWILYK